MKFKQKSERGLGYIIPRSMVIVLAIVLQVLFCTNKLWAFPTQQFKPVTGSWDYFHTQDARLSLPKFTLLYNYEDRPLRLITKPGNQPVTDVLRMRHNLHFLGAISIGNLLELGLDIPMVADQTAGDLTVTGQKAARNGLGDIRVLGKVKLISLEKFQLAGGLEVAMHTATADFVGEDSGSVALRAMGSYQLGPVDFSLNAGVKLRTDESLNKLGFQPQSFGQQFVASGAVRWNLLNRANAGFGVLADVHTSVALANSVSEEEVPTELLLGLQARFPHGFRATTGAGLGLTRGVGVPAYRALIGLSWTWETNKPCPPCESNNTCDTPHWRTVTKVVKKTVYIPIPIPIVVTLPSLYFDTDKSDLKLEGKNKLDTVVRALQAFPGVFKTIRVEGHADMRGSTVYNQALSEARASTVAQYLRSQGIEVTIQDIGYGEMAPLSKDKTKEGLQTNRRVDLRAVYKERKTITIE